MLVVKKKNGRVKYKYTDEVIDSVVYSYIEWLEWNGMYAKYENFLWFFSEEYEINTNKIDDNDLKKLYNIVYSKL